MSRQLMLKKQPRHVWSARLVAATLQSDERLLSLAFASPNPVPVHTPHVASIANASVFRAILYTLPPLIPRITERFFPRRVTGDGREPRGDIRQLTESGTHR